MKLPLPDPLHPADFCRKWVPLVNGIHFGEYGYRKAASKFLAEVTGYTEKTCSTLLSESMKDLPESLPVKLGAIDSLWDAQKNQVLTPLHPRDFCAKWTPEFYGKKPGEYGYGVASIKLLASITDYEENSCRDLLYKETRASKLLLAYLALVDLVWSAPLMNLPTENLKKLFSDG